MKKIIAFLFFKVNLAMALTVLLAVGPAKGQEFPDGLVGLSSTTPGVLYSIDASNGQATPIVTLNGNVSFTGLAYLQGTLYGTDLIDFPGSPSFSVGSISTDGVITFLSNQNGSANWHGLAADEAGGVMYSIDLDNNNTLTAQFPDGTVQTIGSGAGIDGRGMEYDDTHGILYATGDDDVSLYTVSISTGTSTLIGPTGLNSSRVGLAYDECNEILYLNDAELGQLYTLDVNTGAATLVGSNGVVLEDTGIDGLAWMGECGPPPTPAQIPTLSEWGLIAMAGLMGIVGFLVMRRRVTA